jgi:hypothetical protein
MPFHQTVGGKVNDVRLRRLDGADETRPPRHMAYVLDRATAANALKWRNSTSMFPEKRPLQE